MRITVFASLDFNHKARKEKKHKGHKEKNVELKINQMDNYYWKLERDCLTDVPNGIERLCDLSDNFVPFAVKKITFLQFTKTESLKSSPGSCSYVEGGTILTLYRTFLNTL